MGRRRQKEENSMSAQFEDRVRFNWGFHDAAQVVREGWEGQNYGFIGTALNITKPEDELEQHQDKAYAHGWYFGYYEALGGVSSCESSEGAWKAYAG